MKGRLVLLEKRWRCLSFKIKCFVDLIGLEDGVEDDAYFEFVRGGGSEVGLNDWETTAPMKGATAWGTDSTTIKEVLAHLCSAPDEEYQPIQGSNQYGKRSVQKASWTQETCDRISFALEKDEFALEKEAAHRSCLVAFAGEMAVERADDEGPIEGADDDDNPLAQAVPPVANLPEVEEQEQEMLDSLVLVGSPKDE